MFLLIGLWSWLAARREICLGKAYSLCQVSQSKNKIGTPVASTMGDTKIIPKKAKNTRPRVVKTRQSLVQCILKLQEVKDKLTNNWCARVLVGVYHIYLRTEEGEIAKLHETGCSRRWIKMVRHTWAHSLAPSLSPYSNWATAISATVGNRSTH